MNEEYGVDAGESQRDFSLQEEANRWDLAFRSEVLRGQEPNPGVVRFVRVQLKGRGGRILDLGCGYGRHLRHLSEQGFRSVGVDLSAAALAGARSQLRQAGLFSAALVQGSFNRLPLADGSFAGAVSVQAIYHGPGGEVLAALRELCRVLEPNGQAFVHFLSDRNTNFGRGQKMEAKTFRLQGGVDSGAPHHFVNQADIQRMCAQAGLLLSLLRLEEYLADDGHRSSSWFAVLTRPNR